MLLSRASQVRVIDATYRQLFTHEVLTNIVDSIPDEWLIEDGRDLSVSEVRNVYVSFLKGRLANAEIFIKQIENER